MLKVIKSNIEIIINSAADRSISLKFGIQFNRITNDTLQMFKIKQPEVKVKKS